MQAVPGVHQRSVMWIMQDAARERRAPKEQGDQALPLSEHHEQGGAAAWAVELMRRVGTSSKSSEVLRAGWAYTPWTQEELQWHSTKQEAVNENRVGIAERKGG